MNFLAASFLKILPEEDSFWMMVKLIEEILPAHYYESDLRGIKAESDLFAMIVEREVSPLLPTFFFFFFFFFFFLCGNV